MLLHISDKVLPVKEISYFSGLALGDGTGVVSADVMSGMGTSVGTMVFSVYFTE